MFLTRLRSAKGAVCGQYFGLLAETRSRRNPRDSRGNHASLRKVKNGYRWTGTVALGYREEVIDYDVLIPYIRMHRQMPLTNVILRMESISSIRLNKSSNHPHTPEYSSMQGLTSGLKSKSVVLDQW